MSEKTLYKIIDSGLLKVRNIDMPRKIRMRKRTTKLAAYKIDKKCLEGRRYEDFLKYLEIHPDTHIVQMDTVEGAKGESCLLTLHFTASSFMIAFKRDFNDSKSVTDIFNDIYDRLGANQFKKLFPVILTDNGSEFLIRLLLSLMTTVKEEREYFTATLPHLMKLCGIPHKNQRKN